MKSIVLSDEQVEKLENGESVKVESDDLGRVVTVETTSQEIEVNAVDSVEGSEDADKSFKKEKKDQKSVSELKSRLVKVLTEKKKLQKKTDTLQEEIDHHNDQIRMAKKESREDLVDKIRGKKSDKMDRLSELNGQINDLKETEHSIRDRIDEAEV